MLSRNPIQSADKLRQTVAACALALALALPASAQERQIIIDPAQPTQPAPEATTPDEGSGETAAPLDMTLIVPAQEEDELSASEYVGRAVYNPSQEKIGTVSDLIFAPDGAIQAAVIGVGGFLGLGEKKVGVRFDAIESRVEPETKELVLMLDVTAEQLTQAPAYVTAAMKLAEQQAAEAARRQQSTGVGVVPVPGPTN